MSRAVAVALPMSRAVTVAWSMFAVFGAAYLTVTGIAVMLGEPRPWFAYWWQVCVLGACGLAGVGGLLLVVAWGATTLVRKVRREMNTRFEVAVEHAVAERLSPAKANATVTVPGRYMYARGELVLNYRDRSFQFKWRNGVVAASALPDGQGYRVYDAFGSEIGFAKDRDSIIALIYERFPEH